MIKNLFAVSETAVETRRGSGSNEGHTLLTEFIKEWIIVWDLNRETLGMIKFRVIQKLTIIRATLDAPTIGVCRKCRVRYQYILQTVVVVLEYKSITHAEDWSRSEIVIDELSMLHNPQGICFVWCIDIRHD